MENTNEPSRIGRVIGGSPDICKCPEGLETFVRMPRSIWNDIVALRDIYYPKECAVFLVLRPNHNMLNVIDYVLPSQGVTNSTVKINDVGPNTTIGHLHSHGTFGAFFSGTDRAHFNYDTHITIGSEHGNGEGIHYIDKLSVVCMVRTKTSCNRIIQRYATLDVYDDIPKGIKIEITGGLSPIEEEDCSVPVIVVKTPKPEELKFESKGTVEIKKPRKGFITNLKEALRR